MAISFETGQVFRARPMTKPFMFHYGIIIHRNGQPFVLHNPFPLSPQIDTIEDFFYHRILEKDYGKLTDKSDMELWNTFNDLRGRKYSLLTFNCEDFVNDMIGNFRFQRGKIELFLFVAILGAISYIAIERTP